MCETRAERRNGYERPFPTTLALPAGRRAVWTIWRSIMREFHVNQSPEAHYTVYKLTSPTGKIYIGCTGMKPRSRWHQGSGYKNNIILNGDIEKFGWNAFEKEIVCEKLTKAGAEGIEKQLVDLLDAQNPRKGYNIHAGGARKGATTSALGKQHVRKSLIRLYSRNPDHAKRISASVKIANSRPEAKEKRRQLALAYIARTGDKEFRSPIPVICIETGIRYSSMREAGKAAGVNHRNISYVCSGVDVTAGGYHWKYA